MNTKSFTKLAAVSVIALGASLYANNVMAAAYTLGTDLAVSFTATLIDSVNVTVTPGDFGTLAAMNSSTVGDTASITLPPLASSVLVDDHSTGMGTATQASIVGLNSTPGAGAQVVIGGGFLNETMAVTFDNCQNLSTGGGPVLRFSAVTTSIGGAAYDCVAPMAAGHILTLDGTGNGTFYVGATLTTDGSTNTVYPAGVYTGSVDMQITY